MYDAVHNSGAVAISGVVCISRCHLNHRGACASRKYANKMLASIRKECSGQQNCTAASWSEQDVMRVTMAILCVSSVLSESDIEQTHARRAQPTAHNKPHRQPEASWICADASDLVSLVQCFPTLFLEAHTMHFVWLPYLTHQFQVWKSLLIIIWIGCVWLGRVGKSSVGLSSETLLHMFPHAPVCMEVKLAMVAYLNGALSNLCVLFICYFVAICHI